MIWKNLEYWHSALNRFRDEIRKTTFAGIVLDYDGTIVDTRAIVMSRPMTT